MVQGKEDRNQSEQLYKHPDVFCLCKEVRWMLRTFRWTIFTMFWKKTIYFLVLAYAFALDMTMCTCGSMNICRLHWGSTCSQRHQFLWSPSLEEKCCCYCVNVAIYGYSWCELQYELSVMSHNTYISKVPLGNTNAVNAKLLYLFFLS